MKTTIVQATVSQKDKFRTRFADIVSRNESLKDQYVIQFFDTTSKSNYVFKSHDGKSMRILDFLTVEELELYRALKKDWLG